MTKYTIPSKCLDRAAKVLDSATKNHDLQNVIGLVSSSKETLLSHASGASFEDSTVKINSNSIFAIASMTKLVTTIAALQLVENNQIGLLDEIESYIPELKNLNILQSIDQGGHANYLKPERSPLIKELITHTSGYAYSMWNEKIFISDNLKITSSNIDYLETPLTFEPGTRWEYGIGIDILGILIERVTNLPLEEYFIKNIFFPLSMNDTSFSIKEGKRDRVLSMMKRDSKGLIKSDLFQPEFNNLDSPMVHGGGGLYSTVIDFAQLLRTLLNQGSFNEHQILLPETVSQMFINQINSYQLRPHISQMPDLTKNLDLTFGKEAEWGLGFMIHPKGTKNGRSPGSASWAGFFNTYFWLDPLQDIFGIFSTQVLPFLDPVTFNTFQEFERAIYGVEQ